MSICFGLLGRSLTHSFSARHFNAKFQAEGWDAHYELFPLGEIDALAPVLARRDVLGLNVTIPYKVAVMRFCGALTPAAQSVGAVNTLGRDAQGVWWGHNTDVAGFLHGLFSIPYYKECIEHKGIKSLGAVLICGTGGAALAVRAALMQAGLAASQLVMVARQRLQPDDLLYNELTAERLASFGLIVNCTPVGMYPAVDGLLPLPYHGLHTQQMVYDLIYNPEETRLLQVAAAAGCAVQNGLPMLIAQAEASWAWWQSLQEVPRVR